VSSGITSGVTATPASVPGLYVGTSGWSYPSWRPDFYPSGTKPEDFLRHYAERFPTVELNTTGYRLPREELFERWAEQTPAGFLFAPKLNAHRRSDFGTFAERVGLLGERLGPIRVLVAAARDEGLLTLVLGSFDPEVSLAFDFRHESWDGIEADLPPNAVRVGSLEGEAPFRYLRLRDPPYSDADLEAWAEQLRPLLNDGLRVFCYLKHEEEPTAPRYAGRLQSFLCRDISA
jgi:uncharacterized protein YecE (DUF72 family)